MVQECERTNGRIGLRRHRVLVAIRVVSLSFIALAACLGLQSCSDKDSADVNLKPVSELNLSGTQKEQTAGPVNTVPIRIKVVDMNGKPVANMLPIATKKANAFDVPLAKGELTGDDGAGLVNVPADQYLYVRAWDPIKQIFANNYYDVLPGRAAPIEDLQVTMLLGASLDVDVMSADGAPIVSQPVGMMMSHPVHGPWWPAETQTDSNGRARFGPVPPGKYLITIETRDHKKVELPEQTLMPGQTASLGPVKLQ